MNTTHITSEKSRCHISERVSQFAVDKNLRYTACITYTIDCQDKRMRACVCLLLLQLLQFVQWMLQVVVQIRCSHWLTCFLKALLTLTLPGGFAMLKMQWMASFIIFKFLLLFIFIILNVLLVICYWSFERAISSFLQSVWCFKLLCKWGVPIDWHVFIRRVPHLTLTLPRGLALWKMQRGELYLLRFHNLLISSFWFYICNYYMITWKKYFYRLVSAYSDSVLWFV